MNNPLISIVIPAYKAEKYIQESLKSVEIQTYKNWELIVVEDSWRDKTEEIVNEFAAKVGSNRVQFIRHHKNKGLAATRNTAIKLAEGKYIALLDHDDVWKATHLQESVNALEHNQADLVYSTVLMFDDTGKELGYWGPDEEELKNFPVSLYSRNYITPSATLIKKKSLEQIGLFDEKIRACEDYECWIRMQKYKYKFIYIKGIHCLYRKHPSALSTNNKVMLETMLYTLNKHKDWSNIPINIRLNKLSETYNILGKIYLNNKSFFQAYKYFTYAWLHQSKKLLYLKTLVRHLVSLIIIN